MDYPITKHLANHLLYLGENGNFPTFKSPDTQAICSRLNHPGFNYVIGTKPDITPSEIQAVKAFFTKEDQSDFVWFQQGNTTCTKEALLEAGLSFTAPILGLSRDLPETIPQDRPDGFRFQKVSTPEDYQAWCHVICQCWDRSLDMSQSFFKNTFASPSQTRITSYLALIDDIPVGTCCYDVQGDTAGFYWDAVIPAMRRQGIGRAMIHERLALLRQINIRRVVAQCLESSAGIYQVCGFKKEEDLSASPI